MMGDMTARDAAKRAQPAAPRSAPRRRNQAALERTITALRNGGRLEDVDAAAVALARHLAGALDEVDAEARPAQVASLARVQLATLRTLRGIDDDSQRDADVGDLLAILSSEVGNPPQS
jgi:hypothetical protein